MNIRSVKTEVVPQPLSQTVTPKAPQQVQSQTVGDTFNPAQNEKLVNMLQQQPDIRPEAVQHAQALAADPNYPSADIIKSLAKLVIADSN